MTVLDDTVALEELTDEEFREQLAGFMRIAEQDRKENALRDYRPVSEKARRVWESNARVFAIGGGNGCLPLHAPVLMADGSWKPLSDVAKGDMVIAADPETGEAVPAPVVRTWRSGVKPVYHVTFVDGGSFEATAEHVVPVAIGDFDSPEPIQSQKLPLGQVIARAAGGAQIHMLSPMRHWRTPESAEIVAHCECGDIEVAHPAHCYVTGDNVIVSNSGKTEQMLAFVMACATGIFPEELKHVASKWFRGPINVRIVCESLTTVLYPVMLPKLQWWKWTGVDEPNGVRGHWGWVPPYCLKDRDWNKSWTEKLRTLTVICRDPEDPNVIRGESTIQFTSFDQDPSDFASGDFHLVLHDEPPPLAIWRENEARTMRVAGRMLLSMTWPDDPSIPVDWIFDEVYEPGMAGDNPEIEWVNLYTTDNPHLNQDAVAMQSAKWSDEMRSVRVFGKPIRFSNRIHPLFTSETMHWCFSCGKVTIARENEASTTEATKWLCTACGGAAVVDFNHVQEFEPAEYWPTVWVVDPHPRKPHMGLWVQVDPADDLWVIEEFSVPGDPVDVRKACDEVESRHGLMIALRLIDPNMARSPSSARRGRVWQDEFDDAGLVTELADDSETGRKTLNTMLKPDEGTMRPRIHFHPRCKMTAYQLKRYSWDDYKRSAEKDQKQFPKAKHDDYCACLKYVMNRAPTFNGLRGMGKILSRHGTRRGAY